MVAPAKSHSVCFDFQKTFHINVFCTLTIFMFVLLCASLAAHSFAVHSVLGSLTGTLSNRRRGRGSLVVGRWTCNPEVPGSNPPPCHWMDLSSVAPNSTPPRLVNSQLVNLPPVGILNLLC